MLCVTHWNVRAQPELGLECAAEGGRLAKGQPMYGRSPYYAPPSAAMYGRIPYYTG